MNWFHLMLILGAIQGMSLILIMYKTGKLTRPGSIYSLIIFFNSIMLLGEVLFMSTLVMKLPVLIVLFDISLFLFGPLIYLFIMALFEQRPNRAYLHFLPLICFELFINPLIELGNHGFVVVFDQNVINSFWNFSEALGIFSLGAYLYASWLLLNNQRARSVNERFARTFLKWIFIGVGFWIFTFLLRFTDYDFLGGYKGYSYTWLYLVVTSYIFGYYILLNKKILFKINKYEGITLSKTKVNKILNDLNVLMLNEKLYLNKQLSLSDLSQRIGQRANVISMILNKELNMNFHTYLNKFRVAEFVEKANNPECKNFTIEGIAMLSGFSSKSTFHSAFKKEYGRQKPSDFMLK